MWRGDAVTRHDDEDGNPLGAWVGATCDERNAVADAIPKEERSVFASHTHFMGSPEVYTEWGRNGAALPSFADSTMSDGSRPCRHWVFAPTAPALLAELDRETKP